jgi:flagellin-like hook-associated protein FlgL
MLAATVHLPPTTFQVDRPVAAQVGGRGWSSPFTKSTEVALTGISLFRIQDADFAAETANLSRSQILQQAGTAMVAQANSLPQGVLQLLK